MNSILQDKYDELNTADQAECWYLVKQPTDFSHLCYLVSILETYKSDNKDMDFSTFFTQDVERIKSEVRLEISNNYRALRVAAFFGLITMRASRYEDATITDSYFEIKERCQGAFEEIDKYLDIIERQIEKMFVSSEIDEGSTGIRKGFKLYPVMLLYKVLLELGRATGEYKVNINEYRYLIATTKRFEDFLKTLLLITIFREDEENNSTFERFKSKFDNRLIQALKQLPALDVVTNSHISIKSDKIDEVAKKVFLFEQNPNIFKREDYLEFLGSTKTIFDLEDSSDADDDETETSFLIDEPERVRSGRNVLLYGVPGAGKSHTINEEYCKDESKITRVVFHPDYMNTDFVGQILPTIDKDGNITYAFTAGPFTKIMEKAYKNPKEEYYLIIEEINRGNAPAIFGEIFQLLDRDETGSSKYSVTNAMIAKIMYGNAEKQIRIPSNLTILATMNTADQNVFTLDTAFQRRWSMRMIENKVESANHALEVIADTTVTWQRFNKVINSNILNSNSSMMSSEDKRLGAYFVTRYDLIDKDVNIFAEKVIKYLWDDAFKFFRGKLFDSAYKSLEEVINDFSSKHGNRRFDIFIESVKTELLQDSETESSRTEGV